LAVGTFCHGVKVRHELRQVLEAAPEAVNFGERHFGPNGFPHVHATRSAKRSLGGVPLGLTVHVWPMPRDTAIQQGCRRRRDERADGRPSKRAGEQQQCAAPKREPVFSVA
jgi:hypothetical protein